MGIHVYLDIFPERIDPKIWHALYLDTLRLFKSWPGGLVGLREETIGDCKRLTYSSHIEHDEDDPVKRRWKVEGDQESGETGESFELYAHLNRYRRAEEIITQDHPSLLDNLTCRCQAGCSVFGSKTQGHPYHYAILAVAMLVEDTFPKAALACGNITLPQARKAQQSVREILGRDVALPLAVDGERLLRELIRQDGMEKGIQQFFLAYHGEDDDGIQIVARNVEPTILQRCYARFLASCPPPKTVGFDGACQDWINADGDLSALINMACLNEVGPQADPVQMGESLVSTWLTAPADSIRSMPRPEEHKVESPGIDDLFTDTMMLMCGMQGLHTRIRIPVETVLAEFQKLFPDRFDEIRQAVLMQHDKLLEKLKELDHEYAKLMQKILDEQSATVQQRPLFKMSDLRHLNACDPLPDEINEVMDSVAHSLKASIQKLMESTPELNGQGADYIRVTIYKQSRHRHIALTEAGWRWIDQETDVNTLLLALFLVSIMDNSQDFVNFRNALLESHIAMAALCSRIK
ncbi:MAG: hypothetical protein HW380_3897 [Magnetococcales bacterium]|nr:hypothetical protein [Magnetococcales bacterium]HIJ82699.1 hypothetical protein [Magnetococcales bacterium]